MKWSSNSQYQKTEAQQQTQIQAQLQIYKMVEIVNYDGIKIKD